MIYIKGDTYNEKIRDILDIYFEDLRVNLIEFSRKGKLNIGIEVGRDGLTEEFYQILADAIEEIIISNYLDRIIKSRVRRIYKGEYLNLRSYVVDRIKDEIKTSDIYLDEKIIMKDRLVSYLENEGSIDIDGYIRFRLNEYLYILDIAIDKIVTEIREEKKIKEFLNMVKYIMDTHPKKKKLLNLIIRDGEFYFRDIDNNEVGSDIIDRVESQLDSGVVTKSDILLSSLILISPKRLIVHSNLGEDVFLIRAIKEIFEDRVTFCSGCDICK